MENYDKCGMKNDVKMWDILVSGWNGKMKEVLVCGILDKDKDAAGNEKMKITNVEKGWILEVSSGKDNWCVGRLYPLKEGYDVEIFDEKEKEYEEMIRCEEILDGEKWFREEKRICGGDGKKWWMIDWRLGFMEDDWR